MFHLDDSCIHCHIDDFLPPINHSGLLLQCTVHCRSYCHVLVEEASEQSCFLHQLWYRNLFLMLNHPTDCLLRPVNLFCTILSVFIYHFVIFVHILHPIRLSSPVSSGSFHPGFPLFHLQVPKDSFSCNTSHFLCFYVPEVLQSSSHPDASPSA